ncbi:MAG TPA: hypothetical protein VFE78_32480 [Gemmataceae bacterium]|nr:hypothetical protein [Gemmataceae bacterium]
MSSSAYKGLALAALLGVGAALSAPAADTPAKKADKSAPESDKKVSPPKAERPGTVLVTPEEWQRLQDELARLRKEVDQLKEQAPARKADPNCLSKCLLKGKVEGGLAQLQAQFDFFTANPNTTVLLGCAQARATGGSFEGRTPPLTMQKSDGLSLPVKSAGNHQLTLDLELTLEGQGGDTGFTLSFPPTPMFDTDLELPAGVKDVRVNKRPLAECPSLKLRGNRLSGRPGTGNVERLEITWKNAQAAAGNPLLSADGLVQVRVGHELTADAKLTLKAEGGPVGRWQLLLPPKAELRVDPADADRVAGTDAAERPFASLHTVRLKGPDAAPLTVHVSARAAPPRAGAPAAVGPFFVLGAAHQTGGLLVRKAAPELHLTFRPRGDLTRRAATEAERGDPSLEAAFNYHFWNVAPPDKPKAATGPGSLSWLDVEAEEVRGQARSRVKHELTLKPAPDETRRLTWYVTTEVAVTPRWADVDYLDVELPAGWEDLDDGRPAGGGAARKVRLRLARGGDSGPRTSTLTLRGRYASPGGPTGEGPLALPRPVGTLDQGGEVTVRVPPAVELLPLPPQGGLEPKSQAAHEQTWQAPVRAPDRVEVSWRPYRPDVRAAAVADLTLSPRQGLLRHEIRFQFTQPTPPRGVTLRVPAAVAGSLRVLAGGALTAAEGGAAGTRLVTLTGPAGTSHTLVLEYAFTLPEGPRAGLAVPLVAPEGVTRGEVKLRVWGEAGAVPLLGSAGWAELPVEAVKGRDRLPGLVARAERADPPLKLRFGERRHVFTVLVERALIQARVHDAGGQTYRAAFRLEQLAGDQLDVELPAPVPNLGLRVRLDGRGVGWETVDEEGNPSDGGRVARLRLGPELVRPGSILEVSYQLPPGRAGNSALQTVLLPAVLRGGPGDVPTRWQLTVPAGWVTVGPEGGPGSERTWGRRGWLLAPRLALAPADLEAWLTGAGPLPPAPEEGGPAPPPSLACWRTDLGPLTLVHAPQQAWLLACSLGLLVVGLGIYALTRPAEGQALSGTWFWPALTLAALGLVVAGLLWPTTLGAVVYGCEPGAAVLVLVTGFQWLLHERYRRQVVFLPSFSRGRAGSSLLRGSSQRPVGEPSTVDVPPRAGGSSAGKAESRTPQ